MGDGTTTWMQVAVAALLLLILLLVLWLALRRADDLRALVGELQRSSDRLERELLLGGSMQDLATFQSMLLTQAGDVARTQNEQIDSFRTQLASTQQAVGGALAQATQVLATQSQAARESQDAALRRFGDTLGEQLRVLAEGNERRMADMRTAVERGWQALQEATRRSSSRCAPPSTRSCTPRWSSAWARASSRWPTGWSRCTRAWARCRRWRATWARSAAC
jgi:DNA anti-recombination protein RmuC